MGWKTRKLLPALAMAAVTLFVPWAAQANLITDPGFDDPTKFTTGTTFSTSDPNTQKIWLAGTSWTRTTGDNNFAQRAGEFVLLQGFPLPDLICLGSGWKVKFGFDYQLPEPAEGAPSTDGYFKLVGFNTGSWDATGTAPDGTITDGSAVFLKDSDFNHTDPNDPADWERFEGSVTLTAPFDYLAVGLGPDFTAVDNVTVDLVAPIKVMCNPKTFNTKSKGVVTVELSSPPSCLSLDQIVPGSIRLVYGSSPGISPIRVQKAAKKLILKFDRQQLADMLGGNVGPQVSLSVTGLFDVDNDHAANDPDDLLFEGTTTVRVINPPAQKPSKPVKSF